MKEVPEKIYLQQYDENTLICLNKWNISEEWTNKPFNEKVATNIEYIHKDAFIEKAIQFIKDNIEDDRYKSPDEESYRMGCGVDYFETNIFIEDFKRYIQGCD